MYFLQSLESFFVSEVDVFTAPGPSGPETSSIKILLDILESDSVRVVQEYKEKSALKGFVNIGGLWAFVASAFTVIFGTSIVRTLFGITHYFEEQHGH